MRLLVTGGCGFIGSSFILDHLRLNHVVVNLDALTYAANPEHLNAVADNPNYHFVQGDITDGALVRRLLDTHQIEVLVHFAAESHVDNSIDAPSAFIRTNIQGTFALLSASLEYVQAGNNLTFIHISTDEVYGSLSEGDAPFTHLSPYRPNSPYSASKAASDHLVRAWYETYQLPTIITHCSNNFGPRQHREKLIPTIIHAALNGQPLPVYGNGQNIRDWIYVADHCRGINLAIEKGQPGATYCFGGQNEVRNIEMVQMICTILDELRPKSSGQYSDQITFVTDRKGHDYRYAIDNRHVNETLGYQVSGDFKTQLTETIQWYLTALPSSS